MARHSTGVENHVHKYHKIDGLWHCALCTHFMPKNVAKNILFKKSVCWSCSVEFRLEERNMKEIEPLCRNCNLPEGLAEHLANREKERDIFTRDPEENLKRINAEIAEMKRKQEEENENNK